MIKAGDYLYCHSDCYHTEYIALYQRETKLVFKADKKYLVEDISDFGKGDPYMALYAEDDTLYLVSYHGKDKISCHRKRFWTMDELREKNFRIYLTENQQLKNNFKNFIKKFWSVLNFYVILQYKFKK